MPAEQASAFCALWPSYLDEDGLDAQTRAAFETHLRECDDCSFHTAAGRRLQGLAATWAEPLPAGFSGRCLAQVEWQMPRQRRVWPVLAAIAAVVLVAMGLIRWRETTGPAAILCYGGDSIQVRLPHGVWTAATRVTSLPAGSEIKTAAECRAVLELQPGTTVRLDGSSRARLDVDALTLFEGRMQVWEGPPGGRRGDNGDGASLRVDTPSGPVQAVGAVFDVVAGANAPTTVTVLAGTVSMQPAGAEVRTVGAGLMGTIQDDQVTTRPAPTSDEWDEWNAALEMSSEVPHQGPLQPVADLASTSPSPTPTAVPSNRPTVTPTREASVEPSVTVATPSPRTSRPVATPDAVETITPTPVVTVTPTTLSTPPSAPTPPLDRSTPSVQASGSPGPTNPTPQASSSMERGTPPPPQSRSTQPAPTSQDTPSTPGGGSGSPSFGQERTRTPDAPTQNSTPTENTSPTQNSSPTEGQNPGNHDSPGNGNEPGNHGEPSGPPPGHH